MVKKKFFWVLVTISCLLFFSGCAKQPMDPEAAGELLVQQLIYGKQEEKFTDTFDNGAELSEKLAEEKEAVSEAAVNVAEGISRQETKKYSEQLDKQMQQVISYKIDSKTISKEKVAITYTIHGLDYAAILKETLDELSKQIITNESLADDEKALNKVTGFLFQHALIDGQAKHGTVKVNLEMTNVKGKWKISVPQTMNVYLAFLTGNKNVNDFKVEMSRTIQETMMQQNEKIND